MFFFPFFTSFFGNDCNCADRVIDYLENEKYEWVPKEMTPEERNLTEEANKRGVKDIQNSRILTDTQKIIMTQSLYSTAFMKKVLKKQEQVQI